MSWLLASLVHPPQGTPQETKRADFDIATELKAILERINEYRKGAGLEQVALDEELSKGCQLHAEYILSNIGIADFSGIGMHQESKDLKGYSDAGAKSAGRSIIGWKTKPYSSVQQVNAWIATLYHRIPIIEPRLGRIGIGVAKNKAGNFSAVVDVGNVDWSIKRPSPVLMPYENQMDIPLTYCMGEEEWPDPRPDSKKPAGYPITMFCPKLTWQPGAVSAKLSIGDQETAAWISTPDTPAIPDRPQPGVVCLIPHEPLKPSTKYTVTISCKQIGVEKTPEWSKSWSFTTLPKQNK